MTQAFWITLHMDLSEESPDGPGWYLSASRPDAIFINPKRLTLEEISDLAIALDKIPVQNDIPPSQILYSGGNLINGAIRQQLAKAEAQALRIAKLRELAHNLEPKTETEAKEETE